MLDINRLRQGKLEVQSLARELQVDEQLSGALCPFCKGGVNSDKSLSIRRGPYHARYCCHRSSCGQHGVVDMTAIQEAPVSVAFKPKLSKIREELALLEYTEIPASVYLTLNEKYSLDEELLRFGGFKWTPTKKRVVMPIRTPMGIPIGITLRTLDKEVKPKTLTYIHTTDVPIASFYLHGAAGNKPMWIVEDQISALRLSEYVDAVALLGTNLTDSLIMYIKRLAIKHIVICLDADAKQKALEHCKNFSALIEKISVRFPPKDIKDMSRKELEDFLSVSKENTNG